MISSGRVGSFMFMCVGGSVYAHGLYACRHLNFRQLADVCIHSGLHCILGPYLDHKQYLTET